MTTRGGGGGPAHRHPPFFGPAEPVESSASGRLFPLPVFRDPERGDIGRCGEACRLVSDAIWALNLSDGKWSNRARQRRAVSQAVSRTYGQLIARAYELSSGWISRLKVVYQRPIISDEGDLTHQISFVTVHIS